MSVIPVYIKGAPSVQLKQLVCNTHKFFEKKKLDPTTAEYKKKVDLIKLIEDATGLAQSVIRNIINESKSLIDKHGVCEFKETPTKEGNSKKDKKQEQQITSKKAPTKRTKKNNKDENNKRRKVTKDSSKTADTIKVKEEIISDEENPEEEEDASVYAEVPIKQETA